MEDDLKNEEILENDELAMQWLMKKIKSNQNTTFGKSANILLKYAQKCLEDLKQKDLSEEQNNIDEIIINVQRYLKDNKFCNKCLIGNEKKDEYSLNTVTQEQIDRIQQLTQDQIDALLKSQNNEDKELIEKIVQVNRFYNMQLKYAHTARTVYMSEKMLEKMNITNRTIEDIVLTSAVLHDVGRFYQALEYNTFLDNNLKNDEIFKEIDIKDKDHASAGYYYSLMSLLEMNYMNGDISDKEAIIYIIAAFNVRFHNRSNDEMEMFDMPDEIDMSILSLKELEEGLIDLIYFNSPLLNIEQKHKKYIRKALEEILGQEMPEQKENINTIINKILEKIDKPSGEEDFLKDIANVFEENKKKEKVDKSINELVEELIELIEEEINIDEGESKYRKILVKTIKEMIDYDVAEGICRVFEKIKRYMDNKLHYNNSKGYNNRKDFKELREKYSKLDVLLKSDKLESLTVHKEFIKILREIEEINDRTIPNIEKYKVIFAFPFNLLTDADKMDIWNQRALATYPTSYKPKNLPVSILKDMEYEEFFNELGIVEEEDKKIIVEKYKENNKEAKDGIFEKGSVIAPSNYVYKYYNSKKEKKLEAILTNEDREDFYKYNGMKRKNLGPIRALLWTINQFIFTNTRTKASLEIIKENRFLERIYQNYTDEIKEIIKPYLQYSLYYIDEMIKYDSEIFNKKIMQEQSEKIYEQYQKLNDDEKRKYGERLDEDNICCR